MIESITEVQDAVAVLTSTYTTAVAAIQPDLETGTQTAQQLGNLRASMSEIVAFVYRVQGDPRWKKKPMLERALWDVVHDEVAGKPTGGLLWIRHAGERTPSTIGESPPLRGDDRHRVRRRLPPARVVRDLVGHAATAPVRNRGTDRSR